MGECLNRHYVRIKFCPNPKGSGIFCVDLTWNDPMCKGFRCLQPVTIHPALSPARVLLHNFLPILHMWKSWIKIEYYSVANFERITNFDSP